MNSLKTLLLERYRCPGSELPDLDIPRNLPQSKGFFRFGPDAVCYGRVAGDARPSLTSNLFDAAGRATYGEQGVSLPFDPKEIIDGLRYEHYSDAGGRWLEKPGARSIYYWLRPLLPDSLRRRLQKAYLKGWDSFPFPAWPVDRTADIVFEQILVLALKASGKPRLPFVWFWPRGHKACAIVTHDIETLAGRNFTTRLLDIDHEFGIKSSVQIVPEERYEVPAEFLDEIRQRGCEINVHGLNHDGNLFQDRATFVGRARKINEYAALFGAKGFRSPVMYRNIDWLQELKFSYDMSIPSVAHLEPQPGGCCTVLPYSLPGGMTELPLTTVQDYTLFHILNDYSTTLWQRQMDAILKGHGLMSFIVHPDYVLSGREQDVYRQLLDELGRTRSKHNVWFAVAGEVDTWWRERAGMRLIPSGRGWTIEGPGSERATIAYARLDGERLVYELPGDERSSSDSHTLVREGAC